MDMTIFDKEQKIIGTVIACNHEITKLINDNSAKISYELKNLFENDKNKLYHYNFINLYSNIIDIPYVNLFENFKTYSDRNNLITNSRNNYYSYFNKVYDFLGGYEPNIQKKLNENFDVGKNNPNNLLLNLTTFKNDLKNIILKLSEIDEFENVSKEILRIKTFAKKPIFVYGYDICNNMALNVELQKTFGISTNDLLAICFNKSYKQLIFVVSNSNNLIVYDLKTDNFDLYNNVNKENPISISKNFDSNNYLEEIKKLTEINNIFEIYLNTNKIDFKFTDNLYNDFKSTMAYNELIKKQQSQQFVKK